MLNLFHWVEYCRSQSITDTILRYPATLHTQNLFNCGKTVITHITIAELYELSVNCEVIMTVTLQKGT